jgi:hypothetical protein
LSDSDIILVYFLFLYNKILGLSAIKGKEVYLAQIEAEGPRLSDLIILVCYKMVKVSK